jgi:autotransporter-associated beta strand protein
VLRAAATQALGTGGTLFFDTGGNASTARLELTGDITLPNPVTFSGRNNASVGIENLSGSNTLSGTITLSPGGGTYLIQSDAGSLTLGMPGATVVTSTGSKTVTLQGAGDGMVAGNIVNGAGVAVAKAGSGTWTLSGNNTHANGTIVNAGRLLVNGTCGTGAVTVNSGGTLGGNGTIHGMVNVLAGGILDPGASIGRLTVNNDVILSGTTRMEICKAPLTNDQLSVVGTLTYGGMLEVASLGGTLVAGDSFKIFSPVEADGSFAAMNLPMLAPGLAWNFNGSAGTLGVVSVVAIEPTNIVTAVTGGDLTIAWPADHIGWRLQVQTNDSSVGLGTNWVDVPDAVITNSMSLPMDANNGSVFYRLVYP